MKIADTISVNPSKTAMGHVETPSNTFFRSRVLGVNNNSHSINVMNLVFPTYKGGMTEYQKYEVPLRTLLATILIATGITFFTSSVSGLNIAFAVCTLCFGSFLALGLLTRPIMLGAAVYYCVTGALALRNGTPDISNFSLMFGCLVFAVIGGGKYSCDTFIRKAIMRHKKQNKDNMLGYKAFHKVRY